MAIYFAITALISAILTWNFTRKRTAAHIHSVKNSEIKGIADASDEQINALKKEIEELKAEIEKLSSEGSRKKIAGEYLIDALSGLTRIDQIKEDIINSQQADPNIPAAAPKVASAEGNESAEEIAGESSSEDKKAANS